MAMFEASRGFQSAGGAALAAGVCLRQPLCAHLCCGALGRGGRGVDAQFKGTGRQAGHAPLRVWVVVSVGVLLRMLPVARATHLWKPGPRVIVVQQGGVWLFTRASLWLRGAYVCCVWAVRGGLDGACRPSLSAGWLVGRGAGQCVLKTADLVLCCLQAATGGCLLPGRRLLGQWTTGECVALWLLLEAPAG